MRTAKLVGAGFAAILVAVVAVVVLGGGDDNTGDASRTTVAALDEDDGSGDPDDGEAGNGGSGTSPDTTASPTAELARSADQIVADVERGIAALALVPAQASIDVVADRSGAVVLSGSVDDDQTRREVVGAARSVDGVTDVSEQLEVRPPDERCTAAIRERERWACLIEASFDENGTIRATYNSDFGGELPNVDGGYHYHLFGDQIEVDEGGVPGSGPWLVWDEEVLEVAAELLFGAGPVPVKLCVRIAEADHSIDGESGNCRPIDPFVG
jgi:hypothetical protein